MNLAIFIWHFSSFLVSISMNISSMETCIVLSLIWYEGWMHNGIWSCNTRSWNIMWWAKVLPSNLKKLLMLFPVSQKSTELLKKPFWAEKTYEVWLWIGKLSFIIHQILFFGHIFPVFYLFLSFFRDGTRLAGFLTACTYDSPLIVSLLDSSLDTH